VIAARRATGPEGVERRLAPRLEPDDLSEPVFVIGSRLVNIGPGGLMLEAPVPLAPESALHLRLVLGGERAEVDARVCGCCPRSHGRRRAWGVGVQFENLEPAARERLERALLPRRKGRA
jgi:Tfp pilus assembly protein PilZ